MGQTRERIDPASPGGHRGRLSRDLVVRTALRLMDTEGLEAVTMRRVGRELGVEAMSLYNHVHDKEDLLDGVAEAAMGEFRFEPGDGDDWVAQARAAARSWRTLLKTHPNLMSLLLERKHPLSSPRRAAPARSTSRPPSATSSGTSRASPPCIRR
jgi:AcrR family transcriptional regulator